MKQRRTSLKDLAAQLGVSIATVSRALRNSHEVGEEMTKKVKDLAKELNYRPNPFAQSLRKEAPRVIGVIVPNLVTHYYAAVPFALLYITQLSATPSTTLAACSTSSSSTRCPICFIWRSIRPQK